MTISYQYDALDRLLDRHLSNSAPYLRFYQDDRLTAEIGSEQRRSFFTTGDWLHAEQKQRATLSEQILLGCDSQRSVLLSLDSHGSHTQGYSAYGQPSVAGGINSLRGFNGEAVDPLTGCYLLGKGCRAYNPALMRFYSPDSWSPFDGGGINAYAYRLSLEAVPPVTGDDLIRRSHSSMSMNSSARTFRAPDIYRT